VDGRTRTDPGASPGDAATAVPRGGHPLIRALVRSLVTATGVLVLYFVLPLDRDFSAGTLVALAAGALAIGLLVAWQVWAILQAQHPALRAVEAVALSLPLFLLLFAGTYTVLSASVPESFTEPLSRVDSLYFSVTVFATVGFGDVSALSELARVLVTVQMVGDLVLIGLVLRVFMKAVEHGGRRAAQPADSSAP
jgi:voltage-gated potassium channel